jgi:hypothetical protein
MPAESIPRCPFGSNGDLGPSRLEEQLDGKTTLSEAHSKEALYRAGSRRIRQKAGGRNVR